MLLDGPIRSMQYPIDLNRYPFYGQVAWIALLLVGLCGPLGCTRKGPVVSVPKKENAASQYGYALEYRGNRNLPLIASDEERLRSVRKIVREIYSRVGEYFPDDREYTPLAKLEVVGMDAGLDFPDKLHVSRRCLLREIEEFKKLAEAYPEYDFVQAKSLYDQGQCYLQLKNYPEAQACYLEISERFADHPNETIANLAKRAKYFYDRTYVGE